MTEKLFDGLCICTTGLELHVKEQVRKIVLACGGVFDDDLTLGATTHLIAGAVGSQKHRAAMAHSVPVATPKWVFESFRAHLLLDTTTFQLQPLAGLVVCTTGLAAAARDQVERIAVLHGAQYDPNLEVGYTSVLIAQRARGAKYDACMQHGIPVVHISWLFACVEQATLLDEQAFALDAIQRTSRDVAAQLTRDVERTLALLPSLFARQCADDPMDSDDDPADDFMDTDDTKWLDVFDSCVFHLIGFPPTVEAMLQQLVRAAMGTIYYDVVVAHVTHVVVSPLLRDMRALDAIADRVARADADATVRFVSPQWLLDSVKCLRLEPEELYPVDIDTDHDHDELPVPAPVPVPAALYTSVVDVSTAEMPPDSADVNTVSLTTADRVDTDDVTPPADDNDLVNTDAPSSSFFRGCAFLVLCCVPDDRHSIRPMVKQIQQTTSGQAIALDFRDVAHLDVQQFAFVTHVVVCSGVVLDPNALHALAQLQSTVSSEATTTSPKHRLRFVSDVWVLCCLAARAKLSHDAHELFARSSLPRQPLFTHTMPLPCFAAVRASTSVYVGVDRVVITALLHLAGARATHSLSRRNTHLICLAPIGMKYDKATHWGLAVVTARWLVQSMAHGMLLDVQAFQVGGDTTNSGETGDQEIDTAAADAAIDN